MNLTFYIIYTPESFSILKLAIESLVYYTNYNYILVGNGISENEFDEIHQFCNTSDQLDCIELPGNVTVPHGTALTHLFSTSESEYFCFMDSDIFAFNDFSKQLEQLIKNHDVVSSCRPIEWLNKTVDRGYRGQCTVSPSGKPVAMTYFSVYKRSKVAPILKKHKISFERYMRKHQIPNEIQSILNPRDQHTWVFNTAKLVNILQSYNSCTFAYQEFEGLIHLGGVSRFTVHNIQGTRKKMNTNNHQAMDRLNSRNYFFHLLTNIENRLFKLPEINLHDKELENKVLNVGQNLILLRQQLEKLQMVN